ncbi:hypothetical protein F3Y22_tig00117005pilonHSYRG00092 [Hibiscus syriacus]|uniref:Uncharacterized protein n=1 Tax=Hibiscus syriacus TaxID=106335 RepID=A0A6A2WF97_HIBSY|nr:hypothetical protein F3Y22_tig00117005pilonHSYRG00092 [Hibiscus syriacus]
MCRPIVDGGILFGCALLGQNISVGMECMILYVAPIALIFGRDVDPLVEYVDPELVSTIQLITVASMAGNRGDWHWHLFDTLLPQDILMRITGIKASDVRLSFDPIGRCMICSGMVEDIEHVFKNYLSAFQSWSTLVSLGTIVERSRHLVAATVRALSDSNRIVPAEADIDRREIQWSPPMLSWVNVNTDGARRDSNGFVACSGVYRNHLGYRQIVLELDSLEVVKILKSDTSRLRVWQAQGGTGKENSGRQSARQFNQEDMVFVIEAIPLCYVIKDDLRKDSPYPKGYDVEAVYSYHIGSSEYSSGNRYTLKRKIQNFIDSGDHPPYWGARWKKSAHMSEDINPMRYQKVNQMPRTSKLLIAFEIVSLETRGRLA